MFTINFVKQLQDVLKVKVVFTYQLRKSDDRTVVLKNLHVDMTGSYTCEVSTEGFFETALGKSNMTVIGKYLFLFHLMEIILIFGKLTILTETSVLVRI